jgi:hypothetical protein
MPPRLSRQIPLLEKDNVLFMACVVPFAVVGVATGIWLPWYLLVGLSMLLGVAGFVNFVTHDPSAGIFRLASIVGIPATFFLAWCTFFLSFGFRS